jgi:feruloyl esterase
MRTAAMIVSVLFASSAAAQPAALSSTSCQQLAASLRLPNTTVTTTEHVAAGHFTPPGSSRPLANLPSFCRVALTITPVSRSNIKSEIWLPTTGWNGKFLAVGNGAWGGSIQYAALADSLKRGYAVASTDTGHTGTDASFAANREQLIDFGYRSVHETAVQGKATVRAFYGSAPRFSYFDGCSGGGRQAFMEAQRYPEDFDGIVAGAPGYNRTDAAFQTFQMIQATHKTRESFIPASKYPAIRQAALNACDASDGLKDGLIGDPTACRFDPAVLECKAGDSATCLTKPQVAAARQIYGDVYDAAGKSISTGLEPGSEMHWGSVAGDTPHPMYFDLMRFVVFKDPKWDYRTLDVAKHLDAARKADGGVLAAMSTDLKPFVSRGGKMLMYHGWEDQNIPPRSSVNYYRDLRRAMGEGVDDAVRLYMVPGMGHCGGGSGPNEFDMIAALEQWRERGKAPGAIVASRVDEGRVTRTRPLCPYPQVAKYKGSGSIDQAENFTCAAP